MIDVFIIGAGFAGMTAAIYSKRAGLNVKIIENKIYGGKIVQTGEVENYPGFPKIDGVSLAMKLYDHLKILDLAVDSEEFLEIKDEGNYKRITTNKDSYITKTVIIATGSKPRSLGLENEEKYFSKGISFCAACDGNFYKDQKLAVVGGKNNAIESALELARVAQSVDLIVRGDQLKGDTQNIEKVLENPKIKLRYNSQIISLEGESKLEAVVIQGPNVKERIELAAVFLSIGSIPDTEILKDYLERDEFAYIIADETTKTSKEGVFVAGDCRTKEIRQLTTAASDGTIAALGASSYIDKNF